MLFLFAKNGTVAMLERAISLLFSVFLRFYEDIYIYTYRAFPMALKNLPEKQETWVRSPGGGIGNSHQYTCLGNPMDKGAWWATVQGVTESPT